ncbi:MAG: MerR family transcriptional regulator [Alphaproteobacteria bacterium]|nr:MerR family transcriptional regulator [Alphaproteobacteria bacterium]
MIYDNLNAKKSELDKQPPLSAEAFEKLRKKIELETAYVSGCFDGASLNRKETAEILYEDKTVADHSLTEHIQVLNAAKVFEMISELSKKVNHQIDDTDVKNIHRIVVRNLDDNNGGMYRGFMLKFQVGIHDLPDSIRVQRMMNDFGMWLFSARTLHPAAIAAEAHLKLMSIQPFGQGNAGVARFLMNLILMRHGYPPALFSRREKTEYWETLEKAIFKNDREGYDKLICRAVNRALEAYLNAAQKKVVEEEEHDPYFLRIGQLAKECGERVSTLRYWTSMGLLETAGKTSADYTLYSSDILPRIKRLKELKEERYTLEEIRRKLQEE